MTLRARWVTLRGSLGDAESSLGDVYRHVPSSMQSRVAPEITPSSSGREWVRERNINVVTQLQREEEEKSHSQDPLMKSFKSFRKVLNGPRMHLGCSRAYAHEPSSPSPVFLLLTELATEGLPPTHTLG